MTNDTINNTKVTLADHAVDALCAIGIAGTAIAGAADPPVIGGLATIALGKRVLAKPSSSA
jgi:hypothetical protein